MTRFMMVAGLGITMLNLSGQCAEAGDFHISIGSGRSCGTTLGRGVRYSYGGYSAVNRFRYGTNRFNRFGVHNVRFNMPLAIGFGNIRQPIVHRHWYATPQWDYYPPTILNHGTHLHVIPGQYQLNRTGVWQVHAH